MRTVLTWVPSTGELRSRLLAALSYLGVLCFVPLFFGRDDPFVNFHARQGLVIWAWGMLALFSLGLPGFGWFFRFSTNIVTMLSLIGLVSVALQKTWKFPLVHGLSEKL